MPLNLKSLVQQWKFQFKANTLNIQILFWLKETCTIYILRGCALGTSRHVAFLDILFLQSEWPIFDFLKSHPNISKTSPISINFKLQFLFVFLSIFRNLYGNKIQRIPFGAFDNMNSLRTLRLDSNLLECDCSVMWLMKHLNSTRHQLVASANCKSPEIMEGKSIATMNEEDFHCSWVAVSALPLVH